MKCTCCGGTGGSVGNPDPGMDWICDCCSGTGKVPDEEEEEEEDDDDDDDNKVVNDV